MQLTSEIKQKVISVLTTLREFCLVLELICYAAAVAAEQVPRLNNCQDIHRHTAVRHVVNTAASHITNMK